MFVIILLTAFTFFSEKWEDIIMRNVFEIVPTDFFKILTSKNKFLYIETLFCVDDLLLGAIYVSRDQVVESLRQRYEKLEVGFDDFEDESEHLEIAINTYQKLAQSVLRELQRKGWIQILYEEGYIEQVSFPSYANRFVQVMKELARDSGDSFTRIVFSTYSSLKTGLETGNELQGLESSWQTTQELQRLIQNAYYDLSKVYTSVVEELSTNELLVQHFEVYKQSIIDRVLFPLKTSDSILRYKKPILDLLDRYEDQDVMAKMVQQYQNKLDNSSDETVDTLKAEKKLQKYINGLLDFYGDISQLFDVIDSKKEEYTAKSIGKIQYQLRLDYLLKNKIDCLISYLKKKPNSYMSDLCNLINFESVSEKSFYKKPTKKENFSGKQRLKISSSKNKQADEAQIAMLKKLVNPKFSSKNVDQFVKRVLGDRDSISSEQFSLTDYDSFILTIMGAIRGYEENNSGYSIEFLGKSVVNGNYILPLFAFIRE